MARAGLGKNWECIFANDNDQKKGTSYVANWGAQHLNREDVGEVSTVDLPGYADLAWASFPCQDLSLAGAGAGLKGERSGTFWPFWDLMTDLGNERRAPALIVLENVCGALTSHRGNDFAAIGEALASGYRFGALVIDAAYFVPQSRPRLFIIGVRCDLKIPEHLTTPEPGVFWHPSRLCTAYVKLSEKAKASWIWWNLPDPPIRKEVFSDLIENEPEGVTWHTPGETRYILGLMSSINRKKVEKAKRAGRRMVGGIYKRTRKDENGARIQRAEIRFDDLAGCLRTPAGGSSRQSIMIVEGNKVRTRLLSPREAARLMGLADSYKLPKNYNEAYHLAGDGLVVPVVRFLAAHILEPVLLAQDIFDRQVA